MQACKRARGCATRGRLWLLICNGDHTSWCRVKSQKLKQMHVIWINTVRYTRVIRGHSKDEQQRVCSPVILWHPGKTCSPLASRNDPDSKVCININITINSIRTNPICEKRQVYRSRPQEGQTNRQTGRQTDRQTDRTDPDGRAYTYNKCYMGNTVLHARTTSCIVQHSTPQGSLITWWGVSRYETRARSFSMLAHCDYHLKLYLEPTSQITGETYKPVQLPFCL